MCTIWGYNSRLAIGIISPDADLEIVLELNLNFQFQCGLIRNYPIVSSLFFFNFM